MQKVSKTPHWLCECPSLGSMVRAMGLGVKLKIHYQDMSFFLSSTARFKGSSVFPKDMEAPAMYSLTKSLSKPLSFVTV